MADITVVNADVRAVAHDPEDTLTFWAATGYTPKMGEVVAMSGADTVDLADADTTNGLSRAIGLVIATKQTTLNTGSLGYRVTVLLRGLVEGFSSLTVGSDAALYTSTTPGAIENTDLSDAGPPLIEAKKIGVPITATQAYFSFPAL